MKREASSKFEFLMTIEGNIVCQRFFTVKGYNPQVRHAIDLYYTMRSVAESIQRELKKKATAFLYENENFFSTTSEQLSGAPAEYFTIQVKSGEDVICARQFPASIYPPKIRYTVDVRPQIRTILSQITDTMSLEEYETEFNGEAL
jgi:hypothetical protein